MHLRFASYNIHKALGTDGRRDPDRIMSVLREIDADVIALQEADRRFGRRETALPRRIIDDSPWRVVPLAVRPDSIGWHGNALLVRHGIEVFDSSIVPLPTLEPRGAVRADLIHEGRRFRAVGLHLDLSGIRRKHQVRAVLAHLDACDGDLPTVIMGDCNEWARHGGCWRAFGAAWQVLSCGASFPARRPVAQLDRVIVSHHCEIADARVHHSAAASIASDHLPIWAAIDLPKN